MHTIVTGHIINLIIILVSQGVTESYFHDDLTMHSMKIYTCREPDAVGIIIEGIPVLTALKNLTRACCLLLGVTLESPVSTKVVQNFGGISKIFYGTRCDAPQTNLQVHEPQKKNLA